MPTITRPCAVSGELFTISEAEQEYCRANDIPLPTQSPFERFRNMLVFRNRANLYTGSCGFTKKRMFTCIPPESGYNVYDVDVWQSDVWNGSSFGRDYDFSRPFFEQMAELYRSVPVPSLAVLRSTMENSDYANGITGAKNCYLVFCASFNEDCLFSKYVNHNRSIVDCTLAHQCELCFGCRNIHQSYGLSFCENCFSCSDSEFLYNCYSCRNCYGCINMANKEYCFYNQQLTREEYAKRCGEIDLGSYDTLQREQARFEKFRADFPLKHLFGRQNENVSGNYINNSRRCRDCYVVNEGDELENCLWVDKGKSSFVHCMYGNGSELIYNSHSCGDGSYNLKFCGDCWPGAHDLEYCFFTGQSSHHCFGCVGIRQGEFCILNKPYNKQEYLDLLARVKAHMRDTGEYGRFFPPSLSPHYYNRSDVMDFLPLEREEALRRGYRWKEIARPAVAANPRPLPDHIRDASDAILEAQFNCQRSGEIYRIVKAELEFYRRRNLPLPRLSPFERMRERGSILLLHPVESHSCAQCGTDAPTALCTRDTEILCERCFQDILA